MNFRRVNDREMETEGGDGIEDREIVCGGRFSSYESRISWERRDKVNEIVDADMVIGEGGEIEGIKGFNSDGEGIFRYINTDKVREDRMMWIIKRMIRNIIISHSISPPFLGNLLDRAKRGEGTAPYSILPDDTGIKAQSTYREIGEQGTDSLTGIEAQEVISSSAPLFALENIAKISKNLKDSYLIIYKIFS